MSSRKFLIITVVAAGLVASCGPSLRRTYESDNAFARCFDMDYNPGADKSDKEQCWASWLQKRTYNQQDDKIRYAELRLEELATGVSVPGPPGSPGAFDQRPKPSNDAGPAADKEEMSSKSAVAEKGEADLPSGSQSTMKCEKTCKESLRVCQGVCATDAGVDQNCLKACDAGYRICMKGCFEDD
ncbi:MAG: hypothetical protein GY847_07400 [Proteobacteria bacterium]|nr:hypothetical protein [Pseudomonadota bacterium]